MKRNSKIQHMTIFALFLAIELVLLFTQLGYLRIGPLSATLMHIPVIAASILLGTKYGMALGLVFGLTSVWNATMTPGITSFVFSPFVTVAGVTGGFQSLIIAIVPRVLLGWIAGALYSLLDKKMADAPAAGIAACAATLCHTFMVVGLIALFYGEAYANAINVASSALFAYLGTVILTNGLSEAALAAIICMALVKALRPSARPVMQSK